MMPVSVLYLYVWPRFLVNTSQSPWKASWRGGTDRAGLSTPRGMFPYHFSGIWRWCPGPILAHRHSTHALGWVLAHLHCNEFASCEHDPTDLAACMGQSPPGHALQRFCSPLPQLSPKPPFLCLDACHLPHLLTLSLHVPYIVQSDLYAGPHGEPKGDPNGS